MTADVPVPEVTTADSIRTRRRRIVIASVVGLVAVLVAGTVAAVGGGGKSSHVHVAAETATTLAFDTSTSDSTSTSTSSSTAPESTSVPRPAGASPGAAAVQPVQPNDLEGTISFADTTVRIGEQTPFTLTLSPGSISCVTSGLSMEREKPSPLL